MPVWTEPYQLRVRTMCCGPEVLKMMMSPKWAVALLCIILVGEAAASPAASEETSVYATAPPKKITPEQIAIMRRGIAAGQQFTKLLQTGSFSQFMAQADTFVIPWIGAIELVFEFVGSFFPDTDELILEEIIRGFKQVNARLDLIIQELREIKKLIQWRDMQVRFGDIEYRIRLMDATLKQTLKSPDKRAGVANFIETYKSEYGSAGFALYDAIANNDQVFSRNLLTAAIKYTEAHRNKTQSFSKGLFGLLLKATSVELAYGKFRKINLGQSDMWKERLQNSRKAMEAADKKLVTEAWKQYYKVDVERTAEFMKENENHKEFSEKMYKFLAEKFDWRYWLVMAFESTDSTNEQASVLPDHGHRGLKKWKRSYFVVSTDPKAAWDEDEAYFYIGPYTCRALPHQCCKDKAVWMMRLSPDYGVARMVLDNNKAKKMGFHAKEGRYAIGPASLARSSGGNYRKFTMVYFG